MAADSSHYVEVATLDDLQADGHALVHPDGAHIALFYHDGDVHAVDNRCPHMGFPLTEGTVEDGVLTCHWHHARFELEKGDTFDPWADDVQTYPIEVRDGSVFVDPDPEPDIPLETHWRNRLADGLQENIRLVLAKAVIGLDDGDTDYTIPLQTGVDFGTKFRDAGWGPGLTVLTAMANVLDDLRPEDRRRALYTGLVDVADDCAGEPPRFSQYAFSNEDVPPDRLKRWFRDAIEVRDADAAERVLLTAIEELPPGEVAEILFSAATDSLYLDSGHTLDFVNKSLEVLDHVGWTHANAVLPCTVENLTGATRSEELSSWRQPVDLAELAFSVHEDLSDLVASGEGSDWARPDGFLETLLADDPHDVVDAVRGAIRQGATTEQLASAVASAAAHRVAQYATSNEFSDWNTVHHTFTYANAVHQGTRRTHATELYRGALDAAISVYLDRFLNMPPAPLPTHSDSSRDPAQVRTDLLDTFDEEGRVNEAGRLVGEHFDCGGDPDDLIQTLGRGLLREDAGFHTLQSFEAGIQQFRLASDDHERRVSLVAPARYMAAHFPTRREDEQTFTIASRLHRGERIHE